MAAPFAACELPPVPPFAVAEPEPPAPPVAADRVDELEVAPELDELSPLPLLTGATFDTEEDPELAPDAELDVVVGVIVGETVVVAVFVGFAVLPPLFAADSDPETAPDVEPEVRRLGEGRRGAEQRQDSRRS